MDIATVKKNAATMVERIRGDLAKLDSVDHKIEYVDDIMDQLETIHQKLWDNHDDVDIEEEAGAWLAE